MGKLQQVYNIRNFPKLQQVYNMYMLNKYEGTTQFYLCVVQKYHKSTIREMIVNEGKLITISKRIIGTPQVRSQGWRIMPSSAQMKGKP